ITGRVAGQEEVPLSMTSPGRVQSVSVKPGQAVGEGAVLLEVDSKQIQRDLSAARARLDSETTRLRQAQAQAQAKARDETRKQQVDQAANQRSVSDAQSALIRAQADFDKVKGGAAPADRNAADAAVAAAQAALDRAQADLAKLTAGPSQADLAAAQQAL